MQNKQKHLPRPNKQTNKIMTTNNNNNKKTNTNGTTRITNFVPLTFLMSQ